MGPVLLSPPAGIPLVRKSALPFGGRLLSCCCGPSIVLVPRVQQGTLPSQKLAGAGAGHRQGTDVTTQQHSDARENFSRG